MEMFGGLTKTSSRIAIAAAFGMSLGGYAMSTPAMAADLGGDCCADLEERVAELEATTVRKGNKKVSLTISGWVTKSANWWDDGAESNLYFGDKGTTLSSHFQLSGSAVIAPGWSGGYTMSVEAPGTNFGFASNQFNPGDNDGFQQIQTLLSYMWVKSDSYGTLNWGLLSQATDNVALLPDLSGTIIESNAVMFEGAAFRLRPSGNNTESGLTNAAWGNFLYCQTAKAGIGADCNGVPYSAVRYDSPTFGGFSMSSSYGEDDIWDIALKYAADFNSIKVSAAGGYTHSTDENYVSAGGGLNGYKADIDLWQVGASAMHVPSGLFIYGMYQNEDGSFSPGNTTGAQGQNINGAAAGTNTDVYYLKGGIKRAWNPLGSSVLYGEYGRYNDMFGGIAGNDVCAGSLSTMNVCGGGATSAIVTGSEVDRWGLGAVQEIDSAAMHIYARWQHLELDVDLQDMDTGNNLSQGFQDWDLFQVGGVIFF